MLCLLKGDGIMAISMSISKGKGNIKHNDRTQLKAPKNVDKSRSAMNVYLIQDDIRVVYNELFQAAVDDYNQTQKRADRKINDYYSHINHSKKHNTFHELVVQIGNKDDQVDPTVVERILIDFVEQFQKQNTQLKVFGAYIHMDESTPHMHLDYVPFATYTRGQKVRVANDQAIKQMGFKSWNAWKDRQFEILEEIAKEYDVERHVMNNAEKHIASIPKFKAIKRYEESLEQREHAIEQAELHYKALINVPTDTNTVIKQQKEQIDELIQENNRLQYKQQLLMVLLAQFQKALYKISEQVINSKLSNYIENLIENVVNRIVSNYDLKEIEPFRNELYKDDASKTRIQKNNDISL